MGKRLPVPFSLFPAADLPALPAGLEDAYPLTTAQEGMLFEIQRDSVGRPYHNCLSTFVDDVPAFDRESVGRAVVELTRAHPALRTSLHVDDFSVPVALVHEAVEAAVAFTDWTDHPEPAAAVRDHTREQVTVPIDHRCAPLARFAFFRTSPRSGYVTITHSQAILDGWSVERLVQDLTALLRGKRLGRIPDLMPGLVELERAAVAGPDDAPFWCRTLDGVTGLSLTPRKQPSQARINDLVVPLDESLREGLSAAAERIGVPVKSVYLAAHMRVASLWSDGKATVSGLLCNGRPEVPAAAEATGQFLNIVPLLVRGLTSTWADLAREVLARETALTPHRRSPLPAIRGYLSRPFPLDAWFSYPDFGALGDFGAVIEAGGTEMPLTVTVAAAGLKIQANDRYFGVAETAALGEAYLSALRALARDHLADPRDVAWGRPVAGPTRLGQCVPPTRLILDRCSADPAAPAIVDGDTVVTYGDLEARSRRVASALRARLAWPTGPEEPGPDGGPVVGIAFSRSVDLVVALLGVMRAGAAYLPLDPDLPAARIRHMAADSGAAIILGDSGSSAALEAAGLEATTLEALTGSGDDDPAWRDPVAEPEDRAYTIYTSGSTGAPKGVSIPNGSLGNLLIETARAVGCGPGDVVAARTSLSFDIATVELIMPLVHGACIALTGADEREPSRFGRFLDERGVTVAQATPTTWATLMEDGWRPVSAQLRLVSGGEALPDRLASYLAATSPLFNGYGPSEATVYASICRIGPGDDVTIGTPLANCQFAIREPFGALAPMGVPGELLIGGAGLAHGYLNQPDLTDERFIQINTGDTTQRMYRSGDLARQLPDGTYEYLGRIDRQIKLRGHRIEPAEIETILNSHPDIRTAAINLWTSPTNPTDQRLIAYLVPTTPDPLDTRALIAWTAEHLPHYMIPAAFVPLDHIPLTFNGKTDHNQLEAVFTSTLASQQQIRVSPRAPGNDLEQLLITECRDLLHAPEVGPDDNFFQAGGNSLSALRLISRLRQQGVSTTLESIFQRPTLAELAASLGPSAGEDTRPGAELS